ncbi:MAG: hypothetical protein MUF23_11565 [Pirellula sp.]|jgi:hypothetical protein|nr:hypothetical protein [Pirellula sp.]
MPIESVCTGCGRTLRVADQHAGSDAQCPICHTVYRVPFPNVVPTGEIDLPVASTGQQPVLRWFARIPTGAEYGPVDKEVIVQWGLEGRLNAACFVRAENQTEWIPFLDWIPSRSSGAQPAPSPFAASPKPNNTVTFGAIPDTSDGRIHYPKRSQGTVVLILGILSWFLCFTWIGTIPVAIAALFVGRNDLANIGRGESAPKERSLTLIGMWLAGIALALNCLVIGLIVLSAIAGR